MSQTQLIPLAPIDRWHPLGVDDPHRTSSVFYLSLILEAIEQASITLEYPTIARQTLESCLREQAQYVRDRVTKHWADITLASLAEVKR